MVECKEGVNAPPFHPNCRCTYEIFEAGGAVGRSAYQMATGIPFPLGGGIYRERMSAFDSYERIRDETLKIRGEIVIRSPGYKPTYVGGACYGRPLTGAEIINWIKKTGVRLEDGKDYSKTTRLGRGFSVFDVNITAEYERFKKTEANPMSYEAFANICGPYWRADLKADIQSKSIDLFENVINALSMATFIYSGIGMAKNMSVKLPKVSKGGQLELVGVIGNNIKVPAIKWDFGVSGSIDLETFNTALLEKLLGANKEQIDGLLFQVFGGSDGGGGYGGSGGRETEGAGNPKEVNIHGKINSELDEVDLANKVIYEDKNASKLYTEKPDFPQTEQQWAQKQIFDRGTNRINALKQADFKLSGADSGKISSIEQLKNIKNYIFRIDADTPALRSAVQIEIDKLKVKFPDYNFSATFGGK